MRPIEVRSNSIEIPFVDKDGKVLETLYFDKTDANKKKLRKSIKELEKTMDDIQKKDDELQEEEAIKFVKETTDGLLGDGSFDKLYKLNPAYDIVIIYIYQIMIGIKEEYEEEDLKAVENKYGLR